MKHRLGSGRISPPVGFEPATPWSEVGSTNRSAMRTLLTWEETLGMLFHPDKCNVLRVTITSPLRLQPEGSQTCDRHNQSISAWTFHQTSPGTIILTGLWRKATVWLASSRETSGSATRIPKPQPTTHLSDQTWNTVLQYGILTPTKQRGKLKWFSDVLQDTRPTDTGTRVVSQICWRTCTGNPSQESRWVKIQLTLFFKIMNDVVDIPASSYLTPASTRTRSNHTKKLRQISSRTDVCK